MKQKLFLLLLLFSRYVEAKSKAQPCILKLNMESRSFPFSIDEGRAFAKHRMQDYLYATRNRGWITQVK